MQFNQHVWCDTSICSVVAVKKRHNLRSLPAKHTNDTRHTFNWEKTQLLGQAQTKYAREFKEAWHSTDDDTIK